MKKFLMLIVAMLFMSVASFSQITISHQGNLGLGRAIAYYTAHCIPVLIPLNDT